MIVDSNIQQCKLNLNIVLAEYRHKRHWFSARVSIGLRNGCIILSDPLDDLSDVLGEHVICPPVDEEDWQKEYDRLLDPSNAEILQKQSLMNASFALRYLSFEAAVENLIHHWGHVPIKH